jgi:hypothetical protein
MTKLKLIDSEIDGMIELFERTKNPAAAWHAYSICRKTSRPVPDVIQAEIDRFAACVSETVEKAILIEIDRSMQITTSPKGEKHDARSGTFAPVNFRDKELYRVWRGEFGGNPVGALQDEWRDYGIVEAVRPLIEGGTKAEDAHNIVAKRKGVPVGAERVRRIWNRYSGK